MTRWLTVKGASSALRLYHKPAFPSVALVQNLPHGRDWPKQIKEIAMTHIIRFFRLFAAATTMAALATPSLAQSYIELENIDLDEESSTNDELSAYGTCLFGDDGACDKEHASAVGLSLDDVVNCGGGGDPSLENVCNIAVRRNETAAAETESEDTSAAAPAQALKSIDIELFFDYNSAEIRSDQFTPLLSLARDIRRVGMSDRALLIVGHTDAVGSAEYNHDLSMRRARSVARALNRYAGLSERDVAVVGAGFDHLRYPDNPTHPDNRRVQIMLVE